MNMRKIFKRFSKSSKSVAGKVKTSIVSSAVNSWFEKLEERKLLTVSPLTWNVDAGGPYVLNEGDSTTIAATASVTNTNDVNDHIAKYEWDTNYKGTFHKVITGSSFIFF